VQALTALDLAGYIFKKDSPSCGMERVRVYSAKGVPTRQGRGLFAAAIMRTMLLLPVEEEGRLNDWALRKISSSACLLIITGNDWHVGVDRSRL
jgi:uncharacterized protein YbbK (DUF523 family)